MIVCFDVKSMHWQNSFWQPFFFSTAYWYSLSQKKQFRLKEQWNCWWHSYLKTKLFFFQIGVWSKIHWNSNKKLITETQMFLYMCELFKWHEGHVTFDKKKLVFTQRNISLFTLVSFPGIVSPLIWHPTTTTSPYGLVSAGTLTPASTFLQVIAMIVFHTYLFQLRRKSWTSWSPLYVKFTSPIFLVSKSVYGKVHPLLMFCFHTSFLVT